MSELTGAFEKICSYVTWKLFIIASQIESINQIYNDAELDKLKSQVKKLQEEFNADVFGSEEELTCQAWVENVSHKGSWIFNSALIR